MAAIDESLNGRDIILTKDATLSIKINGNIIKMIECDKLTTKLGKSKGNIQTLDFHWKRKKTTSVEGAGTLGGYLISPNWLEYGTPYTQDDGGLYFDTTLTIRSSTSRADEQVVQLTDANLGDVPIASSEADDGVVEWEGDFTFEGVNLIQKFNGTS